MTEFQKTFADETEEVEIICLKLDELSISILKNLQSLMWERKFLDVNLQEGYIDMAKTRYLMRGQKIGIHQVNTTNLTATFKISSYLDVDEGVEYLNYEHDKDCFPQKNINLKLRSVKKEKQIVENQTSDSAIEDVDCKTESSKSSKDGISFISNDPLKWFGILVPENLRNCQSRFKQSACTALKIVSLQNKLRELQKEYKTLKLQKASRKTHALQKDILCNSSESKCINVVKS